MSLRAARIARCIASAAVFFVLTSSIGCTTLVIPPPRPINPLTIYLADYGRHSSLLLPRSETVYVEYAFGDYAWFARGDTRWWVGLRALLASPQSTLGRRTVVFQTPRPITDAQVAADLKCVSVQHISVSQLREEALLLTLDGRFSYNHDPPLYSSFSNLWHEPDDAFYFVLHNCNHETADWLRRVGCQIRGLALLPNFRVRPAS